MNIAILRGSGQIGGTCIRLNSGNSEILLDLGQPLDSSSVPVRTANLCPDAVLISHPHQDHFGLIENLDPQIPVYMGRLGRELIDATRVFTRRTLLASNFRDIGKHPFEVGAFRVTPILVDHSAVDAYAFLVEADGKRLLYSGDFRAHGRKAILFDRLLQRVKPGIDALLMEGTMLYRSNQDFPDEQAVEEAIVEILLKKETLSVLLCSSQNIDRLVSAYRACKRTGSTLVVDFYTAWILERVGQLSSSVPRLGWSNIGLYASFSQDCILKENPDYFGDFRSRAYKSRISFETLTKNPSRYLVVCRMSQGNLIERLKGEGPLNLIYSQWSGYLDPRPGVPQVYGVEAIRQLRDELHINFEYIHTSGHAVLSDLQRFAEALDAQRLIPVHTEYPGNYENYFENVLHLNDGDEAVL